MHDRDRCPLTVLMTADAVGGIWHYALALCAALPEIRFVLAVMGPMPSAAQRDAAGRLDNVVLEEYGHRLEWMQGAAGNLDSSRHWLTLLARRYRADLLHVNGYAHARNQTGLPTLAVAHSDVLSWWRAVHREAAPREWQPYRREVVAGLRAADRVVAPTAAVLDDLVHHYGFDPGCGTLIPNGIDIAFYAPQPKRAAIMAGGRLWDEAKNLALLDTAAATLDWPVEIAGEASHPEGGQARLRVARALGVLTPAEMAEWLGTSAIYAAPARYEPFGLGILEAAASGCALVLGDIPSLRENWDGAALFAPPNDAGAWRTTLSCLIACDSRRETLGTAARRRALAFSRERMATRYAELYCELLSSLAGPGKVGNSGGFARTRLTFPRLWRGPLPLSRGAERGSDCGLKMPKLVLFCHSLRSDWNHGNAHFLRGILAEWGRRGFSAAAWEPSDAWSARNLAAEHGETALDAWREAYPDLPVTVYDPAALDLDQALDGAALVIVHEWSAPDLVARIAAHRRASGRYLLLFHDTHHRMATDPEAIARFDLDGFDGVLAFGEVLSEAYRRRFWGRQVFTWHEAADLSVFRPIPEIPRARDLVWIGNWGDEERTTELSEFLVEPVRDLGLSARVYGVRYPPEGQAALAAAGIDYAGYLPNFRAPQAFAAARATVHVPRRPYATALPGIPTIRVFEALACGIPLVSAPWNDFEHLFSPGDDFLVARDGEAARGHLDALRADPAFAASLASRGRATVEARHSCAHRIDELLAICRALGHDFGAPTKLAAAQ